MEVRRLKRSVFSRGLRHWVPACKALLRRERRYQANTALTVGKSSRPGLLCTWCVCTVVSRLLVVFA